MAGDGWPGDFSIDLQTYAYLITTPVVRTRLGELRAELENNRHLRADFHDLRFLDSALWMAAADDAATR